MFVGGGEPQQAFTSLTPEARTTVGGNHRPAFERGRCFARPSRIARYRRTCGIAHHQLPREHYGMW
jgi:hypothetical protein